MNSSLQCPVCRKEEVKKARECSGRKLITCKECGLHYFDAPQSGPKLHDVLQHQYFNPDAGNHYTRLEQEFDAWRTPAVSRIAGILESFYPEGGRLLDIGCATGALFTAFRASGNWTFTGLEPSKAAYEYARNKTRECGNVEVINAYLEQTSYPDASFNVVALLEVLYYIADLEAHFKEIRRILKPGGRVVIEIPSLLYMKLRYTGLISRLASGQDCSLPQAYLYYFSDRSIKILLEKNGFKLERKVWMPSSDRGRKMMAFVQKTFEFAARLLFAISMGDINLGPRTLFIAQAAG